jgi:hypothetical protein
MLEDGTALSVAECQFEPVMAEAAQAEGAERQKITQEEVEEAKRLDSLPATDCKAFEAKPDLIPCVRADKEQQH